MVVHPGPSKLDVLDKKNAILERSQEANKVSLRGELRVLSALRTLGGEADKIELAVASCYKHTAGHYQNILGALASEKLIARDGRKIMITEAGRGKAFMTHGEIQLGEALLAEWGAKLGRPARLALEVLAKSEGALSKKEIAERTGYIASAGHFQNGIGQLRANGLVEGKKELRLARVLAQVSS
jgi:hypothetical protein